MCKLTIQYGISAFSGNAFECFAGALAIFGLPVYEFGAVGMKMYERVKHPTSLGRTETNFWAFAQWHAETPAECRKMIVGAYRHSVEVGDVHYALYTGINAADSLLVCGDHLDDCEPVVLQILTALRNMKALTRELVESVYGIQRCFKVLKGETIVMGEFDDDGFDEHNYHELMVQMNSQYFSSYVYHGCMVTYFIFGEQEKALEAAQKCPIMATEHLYIHGDYTLWSCLIYAGIHIRTLLLPRIKIIH
jgi:hypothetical protein